MKAIVTVPLMMFLFIPAPARAQFEGTVDMKMTKNIDGEPQEMLYSMFVKKDMLAAQTKGGDEKMKNGKFIFRGDKKVMWIINDDNKSYLEVSLTEGAKQRGKRSAGSEGVHSDVDLRKSGKTQKILGYACDEWVADEDGEVTHIWGTPKLGNVYDALMKSLDKMRFGAPESEMHGWEGQLAKMRVFPVKIVTSKDGDVTESQEVTRIDAKPLEASTFEPPAAYKKQSLGVDMGKMMEQLQSKSGPGMKGDSSLNKEDLEKMFKEMLERHEKEQKDSEDSSKDRE